MTIRIVALCAALIVGLFATAWVAVGSPPAGRLETFDALGRTETLDALGRTETQVLAGRPHGRVRPSPGAVFGGARPPDLPPLPSPAIPTPMASAVVATSTPAPTPPPPPPAPVVSGIASNYPGTAGFAGEATLALPGAMGGRYTGGVQGYATVCAERCVRLPVVDWCDCYWGTTDQRVADISHAAWPLITDRPLSRGLMTVQVILDDPALAAVWNGP